MWCQTSRNICRNAYNGELASKILSDNASFFASLLVLQRRLQSTGRPEQSKAQRVISMKNTSEGRRKIKIYPPPFKIPSQSVILPGPEKIRASGVVDTPEKFPEFPDEDTKTVSDIPFRGFLKTTTGKCIGYRSQTKGPGYEWISYSEVLERVGHIGSGFVNLGLEPSKSFVGICTKTRPEFLLTMLGASRFSMVLVPLYDCLNGEMMAYIINQAELTMLICENLKIASTVIANRALYPHLKIIILIDDTESIQELQATDLKIMTFKELEELGKSKSREPKKPEPDDLFCICYTSGTTGQPKGVMITHRNVLSTLTSMDAIFGQAIGEHGGIIYAYLPCAHVYEIINETYCLLKGGQVGFYSGSTEKILEDISYLKPTVLPLVPKLMNRIYSAVKNKIGPNILKRYLFKIALEQKEKSLKKGIVSKDTIWDYLIFHQVQEIMGGFVEMLFTASAPVSKEVMRFFRCASGCLVFEAYGLSEVCAASITLMSEHDSGFVGPPLPSNHMKLVSVPELFYDSKDDVGEICIRGPNVFSGYFKNPEDTSKALDKDGWHYTGDIGKWLPNGALAIIDRKKHIFKLSQGEYIIPEKSENIYVQSHIISQAFVDGQLEQDFAVAVVVPDEPAFMKWASGKGFKDLSYEELCQNFNVRRALLEHMLKIGKRKDLGSLQQACNVYISAEPFTQENGLLTPTMKLKRPEARKKFENVIRKMYDEGNLRKKYNL